MDLVPWVAVVGAAVAVLTQLRILAEDERYAVIDRGQFQHFLGPGLLLKPPWAGKWHLVREGQVLEAHPSAMIEIGGAKIPFTATQAVRAGDKVRIVEFKGGRVVTEPVT